MSEFLGWDEDDQDIVIGFLREQRKAQGCSGCGTRMEEWEEDRFAYVAEVEQCPGCELLAMEQKQIPKDMEGAKVFLMPREMYEARGS